MQDSSDTVVPTSLPFALNPISFSRTIETLLLQRRAYCLLPGIMNLDQGRSSTSYIDVMKRLQLDWSPDTLGHHLCEVTEQRPPIFNHQVVEFSVLHQRFHLISNIISQYFSQLITTSCGFNGISVNVPE